MSQDIREMFRNEEGNSSEKLPNQHKNRFGDKLEEAFPKADRQRKFLLLKIAAMLVVVLSLAMFLLVPQNPFSRNKVVETPSEDETQEEIIPVTKEFQLSDVSPEYKKVEDYYLASLNIELAKLDVTEDNKGLIDSFMKQMAGLDREYQRLNKEFGEEGPNDQTIEAMISNLQLRLDMLRKLKNKIEDIKKSKKKTYENVQI